MAPRNTSMRTQYGSKRSSGLKFELPGFSFDNESIVAGTSIPEPERTPTPPVVDTKASNDTLAQDPLRSHPTTPGDATPTAKDYVGAGNGNGAAPRSVPAAGSANGKMSASVSQMHPPMKRPSHVRKLLSFRSLTNSLNGSSHGRSDSAMSGMTDASGMSDFGVPSRSHTPSIMGRSSTATGDRPGTSGGQSVAGSNMTGKPSLRKRVSGAFWGRRSMTLDHMIEESGEEGDVGFTPGADGKGSKRARPTKPAPLLPEIGDLKVSKGLKDSEDGFLNSKDLFSGVRYKREVSEEEMAAMKKQRTER